MNTADKCRAMKIKVGDTIFGREDTAGHWHEAKLTLLWLGETTVVWSASERSSRNTQWSEPMEDTGWSLDWREWKKIEAPSK